MRRWFILILLVLSLITLTSCSIFQGEKTDEVPESQPAVKSPQELKVELDSANREFNAKVQKIEADCRVKRENTEKQRLDQNKVELDRMEQERLTRDAAETSIFEGRRQSLYTADLNRVNQDLSTELKKVAQEYQSELDRISKEFDATLEKIDAEYNAEIQKISMKYMDSIDQSEQEESELKSLEQHKVDQEYEAEKKRISQEYAASLKKAGQEKEAQNNSEQKRAVVDKKYQALTQAIDKVQKSHEENIQAAKTDLDSAKASFKTECTKKYDQAFNKLSTDKTTDSTQWEKLISQENRELSDYYAERDKKYSDYVLNMNKRRSDEISKLLN